MTEDGQLVRKLPSHGHASKTERIRRAHRVDHWVRNKGPRAVCPGLFESVYSQCFAIELREAGLQIEITPRIPLVYRGIKLEAIFQPDLVIEDTVVVEVKAVERLPLVYHAQVVTYLKFDSLPGRLTDEFQRQLSEGWNQAVRATGSVSEARAP